MPRLHDFGGVFEICFIRGSLSDGERKTLLPIKLFFDHVLIKKDDRVRKRRNSMIFRALVATLALETRETENYDIDIFFLQFIVENGKLFSKWDQ